MTELLTPSIRKMLTAARQKDMAVPILLFLAGHRPLAFVTGQLLYMGVPFCTPFGLESVQEWASLLSHPDGPTLLESELNSKLYAMESQTLSDT